jgi:hypothetical protein
MPSHAAPAPAHAAAHHHEAHLPKPCKPTLTPSRALETHRPAPAAALQAFSGASSVYALLQAANLRSTIDVEALEPGMAGMQVLMEVSRARGS